MPLIQLIRRDGQVYELLAENISFDMQRAFIGQAMPVVNTRIALDMNQTNFSITLGGILTDDLTASSGVGSAMTIDTSVHGGQVLQASWYEAFASWTAVKAELDGVNIVIKSTGQIKAGLGEDITIQLKNGSGSSTVATKSIVVIDISGTASTDTLANTIVSGINGATVKVDTVSKAGSVVFSVSQSSGQFRTLSEDSQSGSGYDGELITIRNTETGDEGDHTVTVSKNNLGQRWTNQFSVTNMKGGQGSQKLTMEDKVQDFLNLANMSAGGALISPNQLVGSVVNVPDSVSSFDVSSLLRIEEAAVVKKYIVGVRIPYTSLASSTTGNKVLRQYLLPAGIGTDYPASKNNKEYDPTTIVNNETMRPNPFLEQGVAIPCILAKFTPDYTAGDGFWKYTIVLNAVEQLVGL